MNEHGKGNCSCALQSTGGQSIQEMEFERGIWSAAMDGEEARVQRFLRTGVHPSSTDSSGYTPLHYASRGGHVGVCKLLLSSGASANSQTPGGVTPLHRAAYCGHGGVVRELLEGGADVTLTDSDGQTALHKAAEKGSLAVVKMLLASSPESVGLRDKRGRMAGDLIKSEAEPELKKLLIL